MKTFLLTCFAMVMLFVITASVEAGIINRNITVDLKKAAIFSRLSGGMLLVHVSDTTVSFAPDQVLNAADQGTGVFPGQVSFLGLTGDLLSASSFNEGSSGGSSRQVFGILSITSSGFTGFTIVPTINPIGVGEDSLVAAFPP